MKDCGIKVLTEHVGKNLTDKELTAEEIERRDIEWLNQATHIIAEISGASTGTGREIEYARVKHEFGKIPANNLCLYQKDREFYASPMIRGMTPDRYPNIMVKSYDDIDNVKEIIKEFLDI